MKHVQVKDAEEKQTPHGVDVRALSDTEHAQVMHIILEPGESLRKHVTPVDALFYVLEGTGTVEIGDEMLEVETDTLIESPARIPHNLHNKSDKRVRFMVIKTPRPTEGSKLL